MVLSDEMLLAEVARGDEGALRQLYERHAAAMFRLLGRLAPTRSSAEEILQEAWLAVWQSAGSFRGDSSAVGWLLGVARRQAHNRLRRVEAVTVELDEAREVPDPGVGVVEQVLARASRERIAAAIAALPEHHREVVILALVDELPYRDVAAALDIPVGTVKSRMAHARTALARALSQERVRP
jgi:RNA polymerase sigma-70 factor (ECF subfamily)